MKLLLLLVLATQTANKVPPRLIRISSITRGAVINNPYAPKGFGVEANTVTSPSIHLSLACEVVLDMEVGQTYFIKQSKKSALQANYEVSQYRLVVFTDKDGE